MRTTMIAVDEIRAWFDAALNCIALKHGSQVELPQTFYWTVDAREALDMTAQPELLVGDLADDINDIRKDAAIPVEELSVYTWHILDHLRGILSVLAAIELPDSAEPKNSEGGLQS